MAAGRRRWPRPQGQAWLISVAAHGLIFSAFLGWAACDRRADRRPTGIATAIAAPDDDIAIETVAVRPERPQLPTVAPVPPIADPPNAAETGGNAPAPPTPAAAGPGDMGKSLGNDASRARADLNGNPRSAQPATAEAPPRPGQVVIFVIDRSASMGLTGSFDAARRWVLDRLDRLTPDIYFQVIAYNRQPVVCPLGGQTYPVPATEENRRAAATWLAGLEAEGGSNHLAALRQALVRGANVIDLLTDGEDLRPEWLRDVSLLNQGRACLNTVGFSEQGRAVLAGLAQQNRGVFQVTR
jgi:hypothetical protein